MSRPALIQQTSSSSTEHSEKYDKDFVFDRALCPINDNTREQVIKNGINKDITKLDFKRSKRLLGEQNRFLTQTLSKTKLIDKK